MVLKHPRTVVYPIAIDAIMGEIMTRETWSVIGHQFMFILLIKDLKISIKELKVYNKVFEWVGLCWGTGGFIHI